MRQARGRRVNPIGKNLSEARRCRNEDNAKMVLKEIGSKGVDWSDVCLVIVQCRALVNVTEVSAFLISYVAY